MDDRIGVLADVHGNYTALRAVLANMDRQRVSTIWNLGATVGYGPAGAQCLRLLRMRGVASVQGNHDGNLRPPRDPEMRPELQATLDRELRALTEEEVDWFMDLPIREEIDEEVVLVHGALTGRDHYILTSKASALNQEILRTRHPNARVCLFAHTHIPMVLHAKEVDRDFEETRTVELDPGEQYLLNPGAVGQPRDRVPLASYGVYDRAAGTFTVVRLPYDIEAEQERMREAGSPERYVTRIAHGL